jgi:hypothetical protein
MFVAALIRPFAPLGFLELGARLTGIPASLDLGGGKSVRFIEDKNASFGCPGGSPYWSPDDAALVMDCDSRLEAWTPAGRLLGSIPSPHRMPLLRLQVLANPLRVIYATSADLRNGSYGALVIWNLNEGKISTQPDAPFPFRGFAVDPTQPRIAVSYHLRKTGALDVISLPDWHIQQTIPMRDAISSMQWIPATQTLLLGG